MPELAERMAFYIGRTVTIFTTSGGLSGCGFTGVLAGICEGCVRLITDIGAPPACAVGSPCTEGFGPCGGFNGLYGGGFCGNWLGSITEIPLCHIASFVHSAI